MKHRQIPHYYVIYFVKGTYQTRSTRSYQEALEDLEDISRHGGLSLCIYDMYDWRTDWQLSGADRAEHEGHVLDLTNELRLKYE